MAVWRRKPKQRVLIHSDQGSQFTSMDWAAFIRTHNLEHSMSGRGNCHDNAVAESFFSSLKRERIRRRTYKTREEARQDVFDYIEMFYNPVRKHVRNGMLSPAEFERQQILKAEGVQKTRGYSTCSTADSSVWSSRRSVPCAAHALEQLGRSGTSMIRVAALENAACLQNETRSIPNYTIDEEQVRTPSDDTGTALKPSAEGGGGEEVAGE